MGRIRTTWVGLAGQEPGDMASGMWVRDTQDCRGLNHHGKVMEVRAGCEGIVFNVSEREFFVAYLYECAPRVWSDITVYYSDTATLEMRTDGDAWGHEENDDERCLEI